MKWGLFEMVRLGILRKMDQNRMFAVWRIDGPWQPVTRKVLYLQLLNLVSLSRSHIVASATDDLNIFGLSACGSIRITKTLCDLKFDVG